MHLVLLVLHLDQLAIVQGVQLLQMVQPEVHLVQHVQVRVQRLVKDALMHAHQIAQRVVENHVTLFVQRVAQQRAIRIVRIRA